MLKLVYTFIGLFSFFIVQSQDCPENVLTIFTPQQAADFLQQYPDCTKLKGLTVLNSELADLDFLNKIESIEGEVTISQNKYLKNIDGFQNLTSIHGYVRIQHNDSLQSLKGLDSLRVVKGDFLYISNNPLIVSIDGFNELDSVYGILSIFSMGGLKNISGFQKLRYVKEDLLFHQNESLTDIDGFSSLEKVDNSLRIYQNSMLTSIAIMDNDFIINEWLEIRENPLLSLCLYRTICRHITNPDSRAAILGNAAGCSSRMEISDQCILSSHDTKSISGSISPNPSYGYFIFDIMKNKSFVEGVLFDLSGRSYPIQLTYGKAEVFTISPGVYLLHILDDGVNYRATFIKE